MRKFTQALFFLMAVVPFSGIADYEVECEGYDTDTGVFMAKL